jgi:hypothetical protein
MPAIDSSNFDLLITGGRVLGGAVGDSLRITSFEYDRAMEGTLEGTQYDFKRDPKERPNRGDAQFR